MRSDVDSTIPPRDSTATSVVPPPMSTIMEPRASSTRSPLPIAAAMGSSMSDTDCAPASRVTSSTARFSTSVTPYGMQTLTRGRLMMVLPETFLK